MAAEFRDAWITALDALELDVQAVEAILAADHLAREVPLPDPWSPPEGMGPLPLDLRPRADAILTRQIAASEAISRALIGNRRQANLLGQLDTDRRAPRRPAYIDCAM